MFDTKAYSELFEPQEETKHSWSLGMTEDSVSLTLAMSWRLLIVQLVQRVFSKSYLTEQYLSGEAREQFEQKLRGIIRDQKKTWIDEKVSLDDLDVTAYLWCRMASLNTCTTLTLSCAERRPRIRTKMRSACMYNYNSQQAGNDQGPEVN
jgi:hypothetical protein